MTSHLSVLAAVAAAFCAGGCGGNVTDDDASASAGDFTSAMLEGQALFAFSYRGSSPSDRGLRIALHVPETADPCALYSRGNESADQDFWYVAVRTEGIIEGEYSVPVGENAATLTHVVSLEPAAKIGAVGDSVVIVKPPSGGSATLNVDLRFPRNAVTDFECQSVGTSEGGGENRCTCTQPNGSITRCTALGEENCCLNDNGPHQYLEGQVTARYCAGLCEATSPDLLSLCSEEQPE